MLHTQSGFKTLQHNWNLPLLCLYFIILSSSCCSENGIKLAYDHNNLNNSLDWIKKTLLFLAPQADSKIFQLDMLKVTAYLFSLISF